MKLSSIYFFLIETFKGRKKMLFLAALLILAYISVSIERNHFIMQDFAYYKDMPTHLLYFYPTFLSSIFWKTVFLFPAAVLMAIFLAGWLKSFSLEKLVTEHKKIVVFILTGAMVLIILSINLVFNSCEVTTDELTYEFQAKVLLEGKFYASPPVDKNFENNFLISKPNKLVGKYNLGHPLILAAGIILGNSRIFLVIMSVLLIFIIYKISRLLYEDDTHAIICALLLLISPFYIFMSSTRLSHISAAFLLSLFMYLFLEIRRSSNSKLKVSSLSFTAGIIAAFAFDIRPLTAIGFLLPFVAVFFVSLITRQKNIFYKIFPMLAGFIIILIFTLLYNKEITGEYLTFPSTVYSPRVQLGFVHGHTPLKAFYNFVIDMNRMNIFLFGVPWSLIFLLAFFLAGKKTFGDMLCFFIIVSHSMAYSLFCSVGVSDVGPIYCYEILIPIILLSGRGILWLGDFLVNFNKQYGNYVKCFVVVSILMSLATFVPERVVFLKGLTRTINEPYEMVRNRGIHNAVVFIESLPKGGWVFGYRNNSPGFDDDVIFCRFLDKSSNLRVVEHYKGRKFYILYYDRKKQRSNLLPFNI